MRLIAPLSDAERVAFVACARSMVGVEFRHHGRSQRRVDCVGLVAVALAHVGRQVQDRRHYARTPVADGLRDTCQAHFGDPISELQSGDVVLMDWSERPSGIPNHVGIVFDHPNGGLALVHALAQNQRVIAHGIAPDDDRLIAGYRP